MNPLPPHVSDTQAAAYAAVGRFEDALRAARQGVQEADRARRVELAEAMRQRIVLYEQEQPIRARCGTDP